MDAPATLVWMDPEPPDAEQARALSSWGRAHGVKLAAPAKAAAKALEVDVRPGDAVEALLDGARDAIAARDRDGVDRTLSSAESTLRAHPELPQAAWLMAEVMRARATQWRHVPPADPEAAETAWLRAEAIDGGRVPGVGEVASARHPQPATVAVAFSPLSPDDAELWLDGARAPSDVVATRAGVHTLVAKWGGAPIWAGWIEAPAGSSSVWVDAPGALGCSVDDVARAHRPSEAAGASTDAIDARHVRCETWVAAFGGAAQGVVRVATCDKDRCGPAFAWRASSTSMPWTWSPEAEPASDRTGVPWAAWGLAGVGVAIATAVAIVAAEALQPAPTEVRFVSGGIKKQ